MNQRRQCLFIIVGCILFTSQVFAKQNAETTLPFANIPHDEINTEHITSLTLIIERELESIRFVMGSPPKDLPLIKVSNASAREVLFQALNLHEKVDRLDYELTDHSEPLKFTQYHQQPAYDVFGVLSKTLRRIVVLEQGLEITPDLSLQPMLESVSYSDVFNHIIKINQQLNGMLQRRYVPSDVFQQVTLAVNTTSKLLARFPTQRRIVNQAEFVAGKRPDDVARLLLQCLAIVNEIGQASGYKMISVELTDIAPAQVVPGHVFDVAALLVSEMSVLYNELPAAEPIFESVFPGMKFPSHVYQRARMLEAQLIELRRLVLANPAWLKG